LEFPKSRARDVLGRGPLWYSFVVETPQKLGAEMPKDKTYEAWEQLLNEVWGNIPGNPFLNNPIEQLLEERENGN
jgi:hypothetical protein